MISNTFPLQKNIKDIWVIIIIAFVILSAACIAWMKRCRTEN